MPSQRSALALALSNRAEGRRRGEARTRRRQVDARGRPGEDAQGLRDRDPLGRSPRPEERRHRRRAGEGPGRLGPRPPRPPHRPHRQGGAADRHRPRAKHDGKPYVMRAGSEIVFEARDYMYARLDKQPKDLVEEPGAAAATTTTEPSGGAGTG